MDKKKRERIYEENTQLKDDVALSGAGQQHEKDIDVGPIWRSTNEGDIATEFSSVNPTSEDDMDEDTEGVAVLDAGGEVPMTESEVDVEAGDTVRVEEIQLDLVDVLTMGRTTAEALEDE